MKKLIRLILFFLFFCPVVLNQTVHRAQSAEDAIIAVVNDELITLQDLTHYITTTYASLVARGLDEKTLEQIRLDLQKNGLNKLIEDKLMLSEANKVGLTVNEKMVDERIEEIKTKYPSEEVFINALVTNGATLTDLRNKIIEDFKIKFIIDHAVRSKIYINPQEVTEFYEKNIDKFKNPEHIEVDSIFIVFGKNPEEAQAKADKVKEALTRGEDFLELNKRYSTTPSIGVLERGQTLSEVEDIVFNLKNGEVSPTIEVDSGLYIFRVNKHVPESVAALSEVKEEVTNMIFNKKFYENFDKWIKKLKDQAYVEIKK